MLDNYNYKEYLSLDNKKGLLISKNDAYILKKYNFDYNNYENLSSLIFDINNYLSNIDEEIEELEETLIRLSEYHYYNETKK